jgi:hypothetical protein
MSVQKRELYSSPNGDKWFLSGDPDTDTVFIRHEANVSSGGHVTEMDIATFLSSGQRNPEHQALLNCLERCSKARPRLRQGFRVGHAGAARSPGGRLRRSGAEQLSSNR